MAEEESPVIGPEIMSEFQSLINQLRRGARTSYTILMTGLTGKVAERLARDAHELSGRAGEFVVVDCELLSDSVLNGVPEDERLGTRYKLLRDFEAVVRQSLGGTLFLDNVTALSWSFQGEVASLLERGESPLMDLPWRDIPAPVDVRVIAAAAEDLQNLAEEGKFYKKLYYQLSIVSIDARWMTQRLREVIEPYYWRQVRKEGH